MATATIKSTPTTSNLTVSGKTPVSGTISWTTPAVPSGAIISSCVLTGVATTNMSKGDATVTVNGTTVETTGAQFSIDLGTTNSVTSVPTTAKGGNKNAAGTVKFTSLVYTVTYEINITYTVTFKDWDGTVLKTEKVKEGTSATAPSNPIRDGHRFTGWDKDFNNIISDLIVTAQYEKEPEEPSSENLFPKFNSDSWAYEKERDAYLENIKEYDTDVSFETSYYSIYTTYGQLDMIKGKIIKLGVSSIDPNICIEMGEYRIDNSTLEVIISVGDNESYNLSIKSMHSGYITGSIKGAYLYIIDDLPEITTYTVIFKDWDGTTLKTQNVEDGASATAPDDPTRDGYVFTGWDIDFSNVTNDLIVTAQYEKIEEPDNNELVQGDINEDGTFNDESTTAVRTKYINISDKKSIQVNVLTDNVYISACYLYNANKELVKVIEIPADKKRKFGVNLQELIAQIIEDEGSDQ